MKHYLPSAVLGIALTAAAIGFGAATTPPSNYTNHSASNVSSELPAVQFTGAANQ